VAVAVVVCIRLPTLRLLVHLLDFSFMRAGGCVSKLRNIQLSSASGRLSSSGSGGSLVQPSAAKRPIALNSCQQSQVLDPFVGGGQWSPRCKA